MTVQLGALRDALIEAGATPETGNSAAAGAASYDSRLAATDTCLAVLTWMVGAVIGLVLMLLGSTIALWTELGEISGQIALLNRATH
jgi:hypothetical protein